MYGIIATVGGGYYFILEILWRGYSHWTMIIIGGICALGVYVANDKLHSVPFVIRCVIGSAIITLAELAGGLVVNKFLGLDVWDYTDNILNLWGQICPTTSFLWFLLCIPGFAASSIIKKIITSTKGE